MAIQQGCFSSISEAKEYFLPFSFTGSRKVVESDQDSFARWVLWSHNPDENSVAHCSIEERVRVVLIKTKYLNWWGLVQFWAVKRIAGTKCSLTTSHQPFAIRGLYKGYYSYRKKCMRRNINVGPEADEAQLGPPGRAFRSGFVESSPDIKLYTIQEFPLRDHALLHGLHGPPGRAFRSSFVAAVPVFELGSNKIVGVLEFLSYHEYPWPICHELAMNIKGVDLRIDYNESSQEPENLLKYLWHSSEEMYNMFKEVAYTHPLALGLALVPCFKEHCLNCSGKGCLANLIAAYHNEHMDNLLAFIKPQCHHVHTRSGVSRKAFASGKSCFCRDIRNFSLLEYPLVHHARRAGLTFSVATCVQSIQDESRNVLILEFFLLPGSYTIENIRLFTGSLFTKIKELLPSYKVAGEDFLGEELFPETYDSLKHDVINSIEVGHNYLSFPEMQTYGFDSYVGDSKPKYFSDGEAVVDFFLPAKLCYKECFKDEESSEDKECNDAVVLWSHGAEKCHEVEDRIKLVFERVPMRHYNGSLVQFWAPKRIEGRSVLTTFDQPFVLTRRIMKVTCLYRKECMRRKIYVDDSMNNEVQLGPVGRSFKNGVVESSPDVRLYTIQEFPLRDHAVLWGIRRVVFLPVFELHGMDSVGVLEILNSDPIGLEEYLNCLTRELKKMGFRIYYEHPQPGQLDSQAEIEKMFEAISVTYPLHVATSLTPFQRDYCHNNLGLLCFETSYTNPNYVSESEYYGFSMVGQYHHIQDKCGVAGKALASHRPCFCRNICNLGITDYPLAHYAKRWGFTFVFAICVQNTQFVDKLHVLEFFMLPGDYSTENIGVLLDSLLISVKQHLPPNLKILSEDIPGEPFFLEIGNSLETGSKVISSGVNVADGRETNVADTQDNISGMHVADHLVTQEAIPIRQGDTISTMHDGGGTGPIVEGENDCITKSFTRQMEGNKFQISLDELKLHFGKPLDKAAEDLGVSRSTLKRIRQSYGIRRWPSHKKNKVNQSIFMTENPNYATHSQEDMALGSSGTDSAHFGVPMQTSIHSTHELRTDHPQTCLYGNSEVVNVTIKASYGQNAFIKFQLNTRSTLQDLQEQVTKRLKWEANRFEIKYQDEAKDWITIIIDEDLQYCLQTSIDRGETTVFMSITLKLD